jgi:hypothetical protein
VTVAGLVPLAAAVPMIEGSVILMQPFGEHVVLTGQHPPPVKAEHWNVEGGHFGSCVPDDSHINVDSVELQQNMFEGV